jgi:hypothetical protein
MCAHINLFIYLFIYGSFNDVSNFGYIASINRIISD